MILRIETPTFLSDAHEFLKIEQKFQNRIPRELDKHELFILVVQIPKIFAFNMLQGRTAIKQHQILT